MSKVVNRSQRKYVDVEIPYQVARCPTRVNFRYYRNSDSTVFVDNMFNFYWYSLFGLLKETGEC